MLENIKTCKDCTHYVKHYIVRKDMLKEVPYGHCLMTYRNGRFRNTDKICELWEQRKEIEKSDIITTLEKMAEQVNDIALILTKDD